MCGICGQISFDARTVQPGTLSRMNARLAHRGPDEEGSYFSPDGKVGLAMRRLRVIDLSTGSQPIFNETGEIAVVFNGEIYNYLELREELLRAGHAFKTRSDTETIVHAYEEWGLNALERLNGMFAIALWDARTGKLILARDRMGIKPFYYRQTEDGVRFASEIKALLADPDCPRDLDLHALDDYFSLLYIPGPRTAFRDIRKLDPGCALVCDSKTRSVRIHRYWERPLPDPSANDRGWSHYRETLDGLLKDAVRLQLRSDVPNGVFLSSGLDSATLAWYASQVSASPIQTFTIHFPEESYSEKDGARAVSERCGTRHHEIAVDPDIREVVRKTADFFDEPFADNSAIPTYLLCQFAKKNITVALSGEGGDELFGGYPTYLATAWAPKYRALPGPLRAAVSALVHRLPVSWDRLSWDYKLKQFVYGADHPAGRDHFSWKEIFSEAEKKNLYAPGFFAAKAGRDGFESFRKILETLGGKTDLESLLFLDQKTYLLDQFLVKSDRMSMAHALEVRVPILDHRIVEFAAGMPAKYKLKGLTTKWALRELMKGRLPEEILSGAKKGFSPPIPGWIAGPLRPFMEEVLSPESVGKSGLLNPEAVSRLMEEHFSRKRDHHRRLWAVMNFVLWHDRWVLRKD
jgi:asparagine synthase (glutamine-hydrolysing)